MMLLGPDVHVPKKGKDREWEALREWARRREGRLRSEEIPEERPGPPLKLDRPGKRRGAWMTMEEVLNAFKDACLDFPLPSNFTATTMRVVKGQQVFYRAAVERMIEKTKARVVERRLQGETL
jgi:hypothetical protein